MSTLRPDLIAGARDILDRLDVSSETPCTGTDSVVWAQLLESGFATPDTADDSETDLGDTLAVVATAARRGALTPIIEHGLAVWLHASSGQPIDDDTTATVALDHRCTIRIGAHGPVLDGIATHVPHLDVAGAVVLLIEDGPEAAPVLAVVDPRAADNRSDGTDLIGLPISDLTFRSAPARVVRSAPEVADELPQRAALAYATAMAASARAIVDLTLDFARTREQFGRPLTRFQAVQHTLADLAARTTLMETAVGAATDDPSATTIAAAKTITSTHAAQVAAGAHQMHGAIGFTSEYPLGRFTTALWTWRDRAGNEDRWAARLASRVVDDGIDPWDLIVGVDLGVQR